jgi:hypothetical protein
MIDLALMTQVLFWLLFMVVFAISGQASMFHPLTVYLAFHGLVYVVRPILVHCFQFDLIWEYMGFFPDETQFCADACCKLGSSPRLRLQLCGFWFLFSSTVLSSRELGPARGATEGVLVDRVSAAAAGCGVHCHDFAGCRR